VLRRIFRPKRDEVMGGRRKLHSDKVKDEMGRTCSTHGGMKEECILDFGGKPEGKRALGKHKHTWEDNIKLGLRETGWGDIDWISLA
jgi:hypothetical protein